MQKAHKVAVKKARKDEKERRRKVKNDKKK
jgi:hypothetical protein